jgi:hypothetical protein
MTMSRRTGGLLVAVCLVASHVWGSSSLMG